MKKILLLEDRPGRQMQYLDPEKIKKLKTTKDLKILLGNDCRYMIDKLNHADDSELNDFTLIIIHRSALSNVGIDTVTNHCKVNNKYLVFFSGGISQSLFSRSLSNIYYLIQKIFTNLICLTFLINL